MGDEKAKAHEQKIQRQKERAQDLLAEDKKKVSHKGALVVAAKQEDAKRKKLSAAAAATASQASANLEAIKLKDVEEKESLKGKESAEQSKKEIRAIEASTTKKAAAKELESTQANADAEGAFKKTHTAFLQAKVLQAKEVQSKIELKAEDADYGKTSAQEARAKEMVKQLKQELSKTTDSGKMQTLASKLGPLNAKLFALTKKAKQLKTKVANRKQAAVALSLQVDSEKKDLRGKLASLEKTRETAKEKKQSVLRQEEKGKRSLSKEGANRS